MLGFSLPEEVRQSYLLHNGTKDETFLLTYGPVLSIEAMVKLHQQLLEWRTTSGWGVPAQDHDGRTAWEPTDIEGPIKPVWWNERRVPFANNSGYMVLIDLDAPPEGHVGQIIYQDKSLGPMEVLAPNLQGWLDGLARELERGEYAYDEDEMTVAPLGEYE